MGKRDDQRKVKLCILSQIKRHRNVLFGKMSNRQAKADKWREINEYAQYLGAISASRNWCYVRDVWWPNVRKTTMEKVDSVKIKDEGEEKILNPIDDEVLSILNSINHNVVAESITNLMSESILDFEPDLDERPRGDRKKEFDEVQYLKKQCLKAQIYKLQLESRKLEIELGMAASDITSELKTHTVEYVNSHPGD